MRRTTLVRTVAATAAIAAVTTAGAAAVSGTAAEDGTDTHQPLWNKNGHQVNEHAAKGQARAAEVPGPSIRGPAAKADSCTRRVGRGARGRAPEDDAPATCYRRRRTAETLPPTTRTRDARAPGPVGPAARPPARPRQDGKATRPMDRTASRTGTPGRSTASRRRTPTKTDPILAASPRRTDPDSVEDRTDEEAAMARAEHGHPELRASVPTLEPDEAFLARLSELAAGSGASRPPAGAPSLPGWRVGLAAASVAAVVGGLAWLAAAVSGRRVAADATDTPATQPTDPAVDRARTRTCRQAGATPAPGPTRTRSRAAPTTRVACPGGSVGSAPDGGGRSRAPAAARSGRRQATRASPRSSTARPTTTTAKPGRTTARPGQDHGQQDRQGHRPTDRTGSPTGRPGRHPGQASRRPRDDGG